MGITNKRFRDVSVQTKLTFLAAAAITLAVTVACVIFVVLDVRRISASKATQLTAIAETLGTNSTAAIAFRQQDAAEELLAAVKRRPTITTACILDSDQNVFAIYRRGGVDHRSTDRSLPSGRPITGGAHYSDDGFLEVAVPIIDDGNRLGTLILRETTADLKQARRAHLLAAAVVLALSIIIGVFAISHLQESVTAPILRLASTAKKISQTDDCSIRVYHDGEDEIGVLYRQFNDMLDRVQSREKAVIQASKRLKELNQDLEQRVENRTRELESSNAALQNQVEARDRATKQLQETHAQLLDASRRAGMADIANGVLHNIGNVLNSLNISANLIDERVRNLKLANVEKAVQLLTQNEDDLAEFLLQTDQGKILPRYLGKLSESMRDDQRSILDEVVSLASNVEHIKDIVRAQQSHAGAFGVTEQLQPESLFEDAIRFVHDSFSKHDVRLVRQYDPVAAIEIEKAKAVQIIVNLVKNAKESVLEHDSEIKRVTLQLRQDGDEVWFQVHDSGIGIAPERITTIFSNGFTTKKGGHGFGLHASAIAAVELGGRLMVHSDGIGKGATFTLVLPVSLRSPGKAFAG
ncbi:ATP-binding protein [Rhodopirellula sp. JC639]|uniref:ATP-binding protein n=1 Tax=Stieleria mannarensis TaxID=2755585 RepID=UPI0016016D83|nr:ATP-binding protein [Rhodopirellula sp. JC639]